MEQIIKYELIINKALRSALEYDKPYEQINELQQVDMDIIDWWYQSKTKH